MKHQHVNTIIQFQNTHAASVYFMTELQFNLELLRPPPSFIFELIRPLPLTSLHIR